MDSIPVVYVPRSRHADYFIFHISLPRLNFLSLQPYGTLSAMLILAVCRVRVPYEPSTMASLTMSSSSYVDRVPARCMGGHGLDTDTVARRTR